MSDCEHNWVLYDLSLRAGPLEPVGLGMLAIPREERPYLDTELTWYETWFCPKCRKVEFKTTPVP